MMTKTRSLSSNKTNQSYTRESKNILRELDEVREDAQIVNDLRKISVSKREKGGRY